MAERKAISKKVRFEVFKRDSFTCQYCGRTAPDVVLEVDHINPVVNGGDNDIMNLVTSCFDCNRGKGKRKLTENDEIKKQQEQLKFLNTKREQLKMMLDWRNELQNFDNEQVKEFLKIYTKLTGFDLTDHGKEIVKKWIKEFGLLEVIESMEISINQYLEHGNEENTINKVFNYIPRICSTRAKQKNDPTARMKFYIRKVLLNKGFYVNTQYLMSMLNGLEDGDLEEIKEMAIEARNWTNFKSMLTEYLGVS